MVAHDIILSTANARYSHCAFGLKRLWSALGSMRDRARIVELTIQHGPYEIAETLLSANPSIMGLGMYIWNVDLLTRVIRIVKAVRPDIVVVVGGPEVMPEAPVVECADYAVVGEGEIALAALTKELLAGRRPEERVLVAPPPNLELLPSPYDAYTDEDIRQRLLYVESSRGCPWRCAFCLSSRDARVRYFPLAPFLKDMERLLTRGARQFKFTDRTFNLDTSRVHEILHFFLEHSLPETRLHFEIMPDRLSEETIEKMAGFAPGQLHLEVGIQSVSEETQRIIGRRQDIEKSLETIHRLRRETGALLHADLIVGLPGDGPADIAAGFDALIAAGVHEIQIGLLKRLAGTPVADMHHTDMLFDPHAPYEVLKTPTLSFECIQTLKRMARYFDLYYNNGKFPTSLPLLWKGVSSPFKAFKAFSEFLWTREGRTHKLPLARLAENLHDYLVIQDADERISVADAVTHDFRSRKGRYDKLAFLNRGDIRK